MRLRRFAIRTSVVSMLAPWPGTLRGQTTSPAPDPVQALVGRLDLESYKATIKALTPFGDRRQGTDRNRAAIDWIETQLRSYGCATERENERGMQIGAGRDPHWHQPTDRYVTFSDKDFRLGLNAAQTTLGAVAQLVSARPRR
jgi:hypothetical protein